MSNYQVKFDRRKTGYRIGALIAQAGLTNDELAELLGLATSRVIYEWLRGNKFPTSEHLFSMSLIFSVSVWDLVVVQ